MHMRFFQNSYFIKKNIIHENKGNLKESIYTFKYRNKREIDEAKETVNITVFSLSLLVQKKL